MKKSTLFLIILQLICSINGHAQTLIERKVFSANVNKPVGVKIWLPPGFSVANKYPVIYEMVYDHSSFIAGTVASLYNILPCIVVQPQIEIGRGYYSTSQLLGDDVKYYKFLKDELIPLIQKDYSASPFRIAMGLSQGADYTNYIFRTNPELFSAYAIFATERQINYKLDYTEFAKRVSAPTAYFIATGNDVTERIDFAKLLYKQIEQNNKISVEMRHYDRSEHSYVILDALPDALRFIFRDYITPRRPNNENAYQYFKNLYGELINKYGTEPNISSFTSHYLNVISETKEVIDILQLVSEFDTKYDALDLLNIGYVLAQITKYNEAESVLKRSIQKSFTGNQRVTLDAPYRTLALRVYDKQGKTELAFKTLEEGHEKIKANNINLLYNLGKYAIEKNYEVQTGIDALIQFAQNQGKFESSVFKPADGIYTLIARGFLQLHKKKEASKYVKMALTENPDNSEAISLKSKI